MPLSEEKKKKVKKKLGEFLKKYEDKSGTVKAGVTVGFMADNPDKWITNRLPTGIIGFDVLTGGGWAKGKINQLWGAEGAGKSTVMLKTIAYGQKELDDFLGLYLNNEKTLDSKYAEYLGVDPEELLVGELTTTEESGDFINHVTDPETGVDLAAFDTIQALSPKGEIENAKGKEKSVEDNTIGLIPRVYSQFLRMYTSKNIGKMTLILGSQVRMDLGGFMPVTKETGGNAIKHYNILTVQMTELSITGQGNWPYAVTNATAPPKSFPVKLKIRKAKLDNRYKGNELKIYFYMGKLERKFNVLAIGKDLGLHDGKTLNYQAPSEQNGESVQDHKEFKAKGFKDMYNRIPDEAVDWLEGQLMDAYTNKIMLEPKPEEDEDDV